MPTLSGLLKLFVGNFDCPFLIERLQCSLSIMDKGRAKFIFFYIKNLNENTGTVSYKWRHVNNANIDFLTAVILMSSNRV